MSALAFPHRLGISSEHEREGAALGWVYIVLITLVFLSWLLTVRSTMGIISGSDDMYRYSFRFLLT